MPLNDSELNNIEINRLPNLMRTMIKAIGLKSTLLIIESHGGTQLRIPKVAHKAIVLAAILTTEEISKLSCVMGGQRIDVPKLDKIYIQLRNRAICKDVATLSIVTLAKKYNLTRKTIFTILNKNNHLIEELQDDLFKLDNTS